MTGAKGDGLPLKYNLLFYIKKNIGKIIK